MKNVCVVLVEPQGPRNVGSVCRAMKNFGLNDLRLVNPQTDYLVHEARQMAVKATDLLERARCYTSLQEALADCCSAFGTTRRFGKYREDMLNPDDAAEMILPLSSEQPVAMVFGREDKGLHTAELDLCQRFITIPTDDALPSMNLAQSVALCLYELRRAQGRMQGAGSGRKNQAGVESVEKMYAHMEEALTSCGFLNPQNPEHIMRSFRRIFGRSGLNDREVRILRGLWSQIESLQTRLEKHEDD